MLRLFIALILFASLANALQRFIKIDPSTIVPTDNYGRKSSLVQHTFGQLDPSRRVIKLTQYRILNNDPYVAVVKTKPIRMRTLFGLGGLGLGLGGTVSAGVSAGVGGYGGMGMGMGGMGMGGMGMGGMGMGGMGMGGMGMGGMGGMGGIGMEGSVGGSLGGSMGGGMFLG